MLIEKSFTFDSAHFLPKVPVDHKCHRIHGHTYKVVIGVEGDINNENEWVMDFGDLKKAAKPVIDRLDHRLLNSIPGLENPTAEVIARYIYSEIKEKITNIAFVRIEETPDSRCEYHGE